MNRSSLADGWRRWRAALFGTWTSAPADSSAPDQRWIDRLEKDGWQTRLVTPGRDDATWRLAEKGPVRCLVLHTARGRPLSERLLREAIAARARLRATHAAIISPGGVTPAARPTAKREGVALLRAGDLGKLDRALGLR